MNTLRKKYISRYRDTGRCSHFKELIKTALIFDSLTRMEMKRMNKKKGCGEREETGKLA